MTVEEVLDLIQRHQVSMVDLKIVDVPGRWHHITIPADQISAATFERGVAFDGSSIQGFRSIEESDMVMIPDPSTAFLDPFSRFPTLSLTCDIADPHGVSYGRDPRGIAKRAEALLRSSGIATESYFGPEAEFFIFDNVRFASEQHRSFYEVDSIEGIWNSGDGEDPNLGYKVKNKQGYFPVAPTDKLGDLRNEMVIELMRAGVEVERHHHEVATAGQCEINFHFDTLTACADKLMLYKYIVKNVAYRHGKLATFMPKPLFGDNGSGMHVHQSLHKAGVPLFYDRDGYAHLSKLALSYVAGLLYHAPALVAITNPTTNSYKRLVPGFEAPVTLAYAQGNRSAAVRVPVAGVTPQATRIEFRSPDGSGNPYLSFAAMLLAGLDGIRKGMDPAEMGFGPVDANIFELPEEKRNALRHLPESFEEALHNLENDHAFLLEGGAFSEDFLETWIQLKWETEVRPVARQPHPYEFYLYLDA
ncbi:MAG: type I glutamate--ammonia ligase [Firmicutes bacterium]|nr:type I glutamate--ammonia ligase [Bacillota bacterium]